MGQPWLSHPSLLQDDDHREGDGNKVSLWLPYIIMLLYLQMRMAVNLEVGLQMLLVVVDCRTTPDLAQKSVISISGTGKNLFFSNFATESMSQMLATRMVSRAHAGISCCRQWI